MMHVMVGTMCPLFSYFIEPYPMLFHPILLYCFRSTPVSVSQPNKASFLKPVSMSVRRGLGSWIGSGIA